MSNLNLQKLHELVWPWPWTFNLYEHCMVTGRHWRPAGCSSLSIPHRWITLCWSWLSSSQV